MKSLNVSSAQVDNTSGTKSPWIIIILPPLIFFHAAEITLDWARFLISRRHRNMIRVYRSFGAYKTPYVFEIL